MIHLAEGLALFDREEFWDACMALDHAWNAEPSELCQGLIFLSAGFHHLQGRNLRGCRLLLELAVEYLAPHAWADRQGPVAGAVAQAVAVLRSMRVSSSGSETPSFPKLGTVNHPNVSTAA